MRILRIFLSLFMIVCYDSLRNDVNAQQTIDLGDSTLICPYSGDTLIVEVLNATSLTIDSTASYYRCNWYQATGNAFELLRADSVVDFTSLNPLNVVLRNIGRSTTIRLQILAINTDSLRPVSYKLGEKHIIVHAPELVVSGGVWHCADEGIILRILTDSCISGYSDFSFVYADPDLSNYGTALEGSDTFASQDTLIFFSAEEVLLSDQAILVKAIAKNGDGKIIESEPVTIIRLASVPEPRLPVIQYICGSSNTAYLAANTTSDSLIKFNWYKVVNDSETLVVDSTNWYTSITEVGVYCVYAYKIDSASSRECGAFSGFSKVIELPSSLDIDHERIVLQNNDEDSLELWINNPVDSDIVFTLQWYKLNEDNDSLEEVPNNGNFLNYWVTQEGYYYAKVEANGCSSDTNEHVIVTKDEIIASVIKTEKANGSIYPNPTSGIFYYECDRNCNDESNNNFLVTDIFGRTILSWSAKNKEMKNINLSNFAEGIYFIKVENMFDQSFQIFKISIVKDK